MWKDATERATARLDAPFVVLEVFGGLALPKYIGCRRNRNLANILASSQAKLNPGTAYEILEFKGCYVVPKVESTYCSALESEVDDREEEGEY